MVERLIDLIQNKYLFSFVVSLDSTQQNNEGMFTIEKSGSIVNRTSKVQCLSLFKSIQVVYEIHL